MAHQSSYFDHMFSNDIFEISVQDDVGIIIVIEYLYVKEARLDSQNVWQGVFNLI